MRKHLGFLSKQDEDHMVGAKEELEDQEKEAPISTETSMKKEVVEAYEPKNPYPQRILEVTKEHANSLPKEAMQDLTKEKEEINQENESESCMMDDFFEALPQEVLDKGNTPNITQQPSLDIKEVKATIKSTKKRIVTKIRRTISMKKKRSTINNSTPTPTSKANQANNKRKLAGKRPKQGTLTYFSFSLSFFLLTNWKKRKKVMNNMSS
ncbi:uncharacterized protein DS421_3g88610 [Arachis hypogaea]|nr:uncharacterized protein DS421_3g88610 [Arachis hypogaea]